MATIKGILEISNGVLSYHAGSVEALSPWDQGTTIDGGLEDREGECEAELELGIATDRNLMLVH